MAKINNKVDYKFPNHNTVSIMEAGQKFYNLMYQVEEGGERVLITRDGIEIGAICPIDDVIAMEWDKVKLPKSPKTKKNKRKPAKATSTEFPECYNFIL